MRKSRCCDRGNFPGTRLSGSWLSWPTLAKPRSGLVPTFHGWLKKQPPLGRAATEDCWLSALMQWFWLMVTSALFLSTSCSTALILFAVSPLVFSCSIVLDFVFTSTRNRARIHRNDKENIITWKKYDDIYVAVVESIRLMALVDLLWWNTSIKGHKNEWRHQECYSVVLWWPPRKYAGSWVIYGSRDTAALWKGRTQTAPNTSSSGSSGCSSSKGLVSISGNAATGRVTWRHLSSPPCIFAHMQHFTQVLFGNPLKHLN